MRPIDALRRAQRMSSETRGVKVAATREGVTIAGDDPDPAGTQRGSRLLSHSTDDDVSARACSERSATGGKRCCRNRMSWQDRPVRRRDRRSAPPCAQVFCRAMKLFAWPPPLALRVSGG
jgi:hypothetical protein